MDDKAAANTRRTENLNNVYPGAWQASPRKNSQKIIEIIIMNGINIIMAN